MFDTLLLLLYFLFSVVIQVLQTRSHYQYSTGTALSQLQCSLRTRSELAVRNTLWCVNRLWCVTPSHVLKL